MDELSEEIVGLLREQAAEISALRAVVRALMQTHGNPDALRTALLEQMDCIADVTPKPRIPLYRDALQRYLSELRPRATD